MKIFISHSIGKQEEHLLTVLILRLRSEGFIVSGTIEPVSQLNHFLGYESQTAIASSDILIGVITKNGGKVSQASKEWDFALANNVPCGILVEEGVEIDKVYRSNSFYFNRNDSEDARKDIESKREYIKRFFELVNHEPGKNQPMNRAQTIAWFAVYDVLLAVLPILAGKKMSA